MNPISKPAPSLALDSEARADLVSARQTILLAMADDGRTADLAAAAGYLDRVLMRSCPHGPGGYIVAGDNGRELVTCPACGVSWYRP